MDNVDKSNDSGEKPHKTSGKLANDSPEADTRAYRAALAANPNKRYTVSPDGQSRFCLTDESQDKDKVLIAQDFSGLQKWGQDRLHDVERVGWPHRGKEDEFVDYAAAREAMQVSGLDKLKLPENTIAAILRNEQTFYKFTDAAQDDEARRSGRVLKDGKEDEYASIGPAQMQIRNIRRLIGEQDEQGKPKFPYLQHMKDDPVRACLDKKNAALLVGAYLQDEIARRHVKTEDVSIKSMAYIYNEDVHSFGNPKQYVACDDPLSLPVQRQLHPDLKDEHYPSKEILEASIHAQNVAGSLKLIEDRNKH